jgi:hypothetical protein
MAINSGTNSIDYVEAKKCLDLIIFANKLYSEFERDDNGRNFTWTVSDQIKNNSKMLWGKAPVLLGIGETAHRWYTNIIRFFTFREQIEDTFGSPYGYVYKEELSKKVYVVFRGTRNNSEWYNNSYGELVNWNKSQIKVHRGFFDIYNSFKQDLKLALNDIESYEEICFTGHSLGGALSTLAIFDIAIEQKQPIKLVQYAFGMPKVGNKFFADYFKSKIDLKCYQLVNTFDIVPLLPFDNIEDAANLVNLILNRTDDNSKPIVMHNNTYFNHGELIEFSRQKDSVSNNHSFEDVYTKEVEDRIRNKP